MPFSTGVKSETFPLDVRIFTSVRYDLIIILIWISQIIGDTEYFSGVYW